MPDHHSQQTAHDADSSAASQRRRIGTCPVDDVQWEYDLEGVGDHFRSSWGANVEKGKQASQTELKEWVNRRLVASACRDAGMSLIGDTEAESYRQLLQEADDPGERERAWRRLEREGVDVDALAEAFVTRWAVKKHLTECLDLQPPESAVDHAERARQQLASTGTFIENAAGAEGRTPAAVTVVARIECECGQINDAIAYIRDGCRCGAGNTA